jgi:hypothetical protein
VPGLFAQARVSNNAEILRLRSGATLRDMDYFIVRSNFEPQSEGWRFWRHFRKSAIAGAFSQFVFDGNNDLVVDTESMADFGEYNARVIKALDFHEDSEVHHVNYFRQSKTIEFIATSLEIPF